MMNYTSISVLAVVVSMAVSALVFPWVLQFARRYNIVDNPNARKLQRIPIPVLGGVVVFAGILAGCVVLSIYNIDKTTLWTLLAMTVMLAVGTWDDIKDLSASFRFLIEIAVVSGFIAMTGLCIDDLHGLWGITSLPEWVSIPLSIVAGVGIINAVNLIDGVDGYSSGYGMLACGCFALAFWSVWSPVMVCLALIVAGALLPFFMHNVWGIRSKMFIGDGGTLMLGMLMAAFVFYALSGQSRCEQLEQRGMSLTAFALSVLCIPVFDTLRVMTMRILRGCSPFKPDKTHLHHLFIDMGFSHLGAGVSILLLNLAVVGVWLLSWKLGMGVDGQTYTVGLLGVAVTFGFYKVMRGQQVGGPLDEDGYPTGTRLWYAMCRIGEFSHFEKGRLWRMLTRMVDAPILGG